MKKAKIISALIAIFVTMPIWFYLMYQVLDRVQATELMWFLFWAYMPATLFVVIVQKVTESD